jgi:hypothetical protein
MHILQPDARKQIVLGFPSPGGACMSYETARALYRGTQRHDLALLLSVGSWDGFNNLWASALNLAEAGQATHFAMLHADIAPEEGWLDLLADELDRLGADLVSVAVPLKDGRGVTSSGIGDPADPWHPYRRFTVRELFDSSLPETFSAADAGHPGGIFLHNDGCWMCDLRQEAFRSTDAEGRLIADFHFPREVFRDGADGKFKVRAESEDWYFSRKLHELGIKSYITRKVRLTHAGGYAFSNVLPWGTYRHDLDTPGGKALEEASVARGQLSVAADN